MNLESNGKSVTNHKLFSRETGVSIDIGANLSIIWKILSNLEEYPQWTTTIISLSGVLIEGEKIVLISILDPKRKFKLKIKKMEKEKSFTWGDALGMRVFTLTPNGNTINFSMKEKIGGPFFPLFAKQIPSFDSSFEQFALDLKKVAENKN